MSKPIASKDFQAVNAKPLAGKVALVTGGSRGIGAAIARELAAQGADVALSYAASADKAEAVAKDLREDGVRAKKPIKPTPSRSKPSSIRSRRSSAVSISWSIMPACSPARRSTTSPLTVWRSSGCSP